MDNKCLKNEEKTVSSSYPPRSSNSRYKSGKPYKQGVPGLFFLLCYYFATKRNYSVSHRFIISLNFSKQCLEDQITFLWGIGITFPGAVSFGSGAGPYGSPVLAHAVSEVAKPSVVPSS